MKKIWTRFRNGYTRLVMLVILSVSAGLYLILFPEKVDDLLIMLVGFEFLLNGINHIREILIKHKNK